MKKIILSLLVIGSAAFADNSLKGCIETKLTETTSLFSCPQVLLEVTYFLNGDDKRRMNTDPKIKVMKESKPQIIQYVTQNK